MVEIRELRSRVFTQTQLGDNRPITASISRDELEICCRDFTFELDITRDEKHLDYETQALSRNRLRLERRAGENFKT
jgi:hypothetical protein